MLRLLGAYAQTDDYGSWRTDNKSTTGTIKQSLSSPAAFTVYYSLPTIFSNFMDKNLVLGMVTPQCSMIANQMLLDRCYTKLISYYNPLNE